MEEEITITGTETPDMAVTEVDEGHKVEKEGGNEAVPGEGIEEVGEEHIGEEISGEHVEGETVEGEDKEQVFGEGEELLGEEWEGEPEEKQVEGEPDEKLAENEQEEKHVEDEENKEETTAPEEQIEEEEAYVEEPPQDPSAPYNLSDSKELLKAPFELRPEQLAEVEQLWELYQNYTPAYADLDNYITEKELVYMLKSLLLMTFTTEQLQEIIAYCVRPPHPEGHISYEQFLKMVILRQRSLPIEEELRSALQVFDPHGTGIIDREYFKEVLSKQGHKMPQKLLNYLIKEVDINNDGTIGIEDIVGTMCIDLNKEDLMLLRSLVNAGEDQ